MWDPPNSEDETPWHASQSSREPVQRSPFAMTPPSSPPGVASVSSPVGSTSAPAPTPNRTLLGGPIASAPTATIGGAIALGLHAQEDKYAQQDKSPKKRRVWPMLLLALFTVAGSGAVSWLVATAVNDSNDVATETGDVSASAQPAVEDIATPTEPSPVQSTGASASDLVGEPFALAAEAIRPSVVQLNLGTSLGTGVIIDSDGTILTAAHVVGDNTSVRVTFSDGSSADGTVVGSHTPTDVAVVRVDPAGRNLVAAPLANGDDVRVGQIAVAVGSPFGFDQTVTAGIISAVDRIVNGVSMVQTDAPINPGNSGGPLINLDGEVVGINDLIFTESGTSAGVGFAISIDLAVIIADQLIAGVEPQLALLGVSTGPPPNGARGAQVGEVVSGSAAAQAGLQVGDIVIGVNGVATRGSGDLRAQVIDNPPGATITLRVLRSGKEIDVTAILGETGLGS